VLRPALAITVAIAAIGPAFTFRRYRNPLPIVVTLLSGGWIYWFVCQATAHAGHGGHMNDHMGDTMQPAQVEYGGRPLGLFRLGLAWKKSALRLLSTVRFASVGPILDVFPLVPPGLSPRRPLFGCRWARRNSAISRVLRPFGGIV
jgi:hypothetical protein